MIKNMNFRKTKLLRLTILVILFLISPNLSALSKEIDEENFLTQYFWREVITLKPPERPRIGLVLGGGGARGLAHIGVFRVLEEAGLPVDIVTGTSVGALVGALYSSGISIDRIESMTEEIGWSDLTNISAPSVVTLFLSEKLLSTEKMEKYIADKIGNKRFDELKIPFGCVATDLRTGEKIIFYEGDVAPAVLASATIPGVFTPVEYRHRLLVDGGLVDNIPTDVARMLKADIIIAVNISADFTKNTPSNIMSVLSQSISIQGEFLSGEQLKLTDLVINPEVSDVGIHELWRSRECIDAGIVATRKIMPKLKRLIIDRTYQWTIDQKVTAGSRTIEK